MGTHYVLTNLGVMGLNMHKKKTETPPKVLIFRRLKRKEKTISGCFYLRKELNLVVGSKQPNVWVTLMGNINTIFLDFCQHTLGIPLLVIRKVALK